MQIQEIHVLNVWLYTIFENLWICSTLVKVFGLLCISICYVYLSFVYMLEIMELRLSFHSGKIGT